MSVCVSHHLVDVLDSNRRLVRITVLMMERCSDEFSLNFYDGESPRKFTSEIVYYD